MAAARIKDVPELLVREPGCRRRGELPAGGGRRPYRQRPPVSSRGQQAGGLRVVEQELTDDLGRRRPVIWPHGLVPSHACRSAREEGWILAA